MKSAGEFIACRVTIVGAGKCPGYSNIYHERAVQILILNQVRQRWKNQQPVGFQELNPQLSSSEMMAVMQLISVMAAWNHSELTTGPEPNHFSAV